MRLQWVEWDDSTGRCTAVISEPNVSIRIETPLMSMLERVARGLAPVDPHADSMLDQLAKHIGCNGRSCRVDGAGLTVSQPSVCIYVPEAA